MALLLETPIDDSKIMQKTQDEKMGLQTKNILKPVWFLASFLKDMYGNRLTDLNL